MKFLLSLLCTLILLGDVNSQNVFNFSHPVAVNDWSIDSHWWVRNNLRVIQTNLPAPEAQLNIDSLMIDLVDFSANTLIINGGGIMAFYPTELDFQYKNPYLQADMLGEILNRCHEKNIRVITRFDFSRIHKSIFEKHPEWCYISENGERIINDDMYMTSVNALYVQEKSIEIIQEVIDKYPIDGIFINMPGYRTSNAYEGTYHGIDQNPADKKRFKAYSDGLDLPKEEDQNDPIFQKYQEFKPFTTDDWMRKIHHAVKSKNPNIAICTYQEKYVDIIRHESLTRGLPYWPYMSSDNVSNITTSQPDKIVSNASIQQISFRSRFNAVEPEEVAIRLYQNIASGSGLDISMMGDFEEYEDQRNFDIIKKIYAHHKLYESYYGNYESTAEICVIAPSYWPSGESGEEYRGIQLMLKEAHLQYDVIEHREIANLSERVANYKLIIIPQIKNLSPESIDALHNAISQGTHIIATNQSMMGNPLALERIFGAQIIKGDNEVDGNYLSPKNKFVFKRFANQDLLSIKLNMSLYDFEKADQTLLPIYSPGRPGPPEKTGGHESTGYYAVGIKYHGQAKTTILPFNIGRLYYLFGYEQYKNILLDIIDEIFPTATDLISTNAHERIELILQKYNKNIPINLNKSDADAMILHLVNLTGFSGNAYLPHLPVFGINLKIRSDYRPSVIYSMLQKEGIDFEWEDGYINLTLEELGQYDGLIFDK